MSHTNNNTKYIGSLGHSFYVQIKTIADSPTGSLVPLKYFHIEAILILCATHSVHGHE